ncbi:MAG: glycosyltransferase family 2 protein, partial [Pseudomonadota bacterium]
FTAARGRNAGFEALRRSCPDLEYVQFMDGDCEIDPDWVPVATRFLDENPGVAIACGRRRESQPEASIFNRMCDWEWDTQVGDTRACGGDALVRVSAFERVGGFDPTLIAGEEPELCVRLRQAGWRVWRLDAEMTVHDAAMTRLSQWWRRAVRGGHARAEGVALHGASPERHGARETLRALFWGLVLPAAVIIGVVLFGAKGLVLLAVYPLQVARLAARGERSERVGWERASLLTAVNFPEVLGMCSYWFSRLTRRPQGLIEYK